MGKLTADLIGSDDHPKNRGGHHGCSSRQNSDKDALDVHHGRFWAERTEAKQENSLFTQCHFRLPLSCGRRHVLRLAIPFEKASDLQNAVGEFGSQMHTSCPIPALEK